MGRRVSLPGAAELFRSTVSPGQHDAGRDPRAAATVRAASPSVQRAIGEAVQSARLRAVPTVPAACAEPDEVREEHIGVRLSADLLLELERVRVSLAREHGLPVTRAEVISAALGLLLEDFDARGEASLLVGALSAD